MRPRLSFVLPALLIAAAGAGACSGADEISEYPCPQGGTALTYDNFGKSFFDLHCVYCHGGANGYSSRAFTTLDSIRQQSDRIFVNAAAGNTAMPPGPDDPSELERDQLAEWLACGAP